MLRSGQALTAGLAVLLLSVEPAARADNAAMLSCINSYKRLGVSADAAFAECNKKSLLGCVQSLLGKKFVAKAVGEAPGGYLIDLGGNQSRWLEGAGWEKEGCKPYLQGPTRAEVGDPGRGLFRIGKYNYTWYRQGICSTDSLELEQLYEPDEAKMQCELDVMKTD